MANIPTGVVTFLFTDLEGSTRMWARAPEAMSRALEVHDSLLLAAIGGHGGYVFNKAGDGFAAAFSSPGDAVQAAIEGQRSIGATEFEGLGRLRVRMSLHAGTADERDGDYFGPTVNRCARLLEAANGGQVVCSVDVASMLEGDLPVDVSLQDLGEVRLRDLPEPERAYHLSHPDIPPVRPRGTTAGRDDVIAPLTSFIGRRQELARVLELVDGSRMVTLVGVGGVGKTRLALEVMRELSDGFPDGAWHVDLSPVSDPLAVPGAIAKALRVLERPPEPIADTLVEYLAHRQILMLLDNCEHVVDAVAKLTDMALRAAPHLTVIATSREPLDISGETTWVLAPMAVPEEAASSGASDAESLFIDRARLIDPDLKIDSDSIPAIAQICRRLDGIPLAIELAAARVRVLSTNQIAERLDDRFRLLTGGSRFDAPHHQTLLATMEWSHALLATQEQSLLRRLAVFRGSFTLDAATEVCGFGGIGPADVIPVLARLVDTSLVEPTDPERTRYRLLETVRQYGARKLAESEETAALNLRHAEYFLTAGPGGPGGLPEPGARLEWFSFRDTEYDNYRAALEWAIEAGDLDIASGLAIELGNYWLNSGCCVGEGDRWLQTLLGRLERTPSPRLQRVLTFAAMQAAATGRSDEAEALAVEVDAIAEGLGDRAGVASALTIRAALAERTGRLEEAAQLSLAAFEVSDQIGDSRTPDKLYHLVQILISMGRFEEAELLLAGNRESLGEEREYLEKVWLGITAYCRGELDTAEDLLRRALDATPEVMRTGIMFVRLHLAKVALARADAGQAVADARSVGTLCRQLGDPVGESEALALETEAHLQLDNADAAGATIRAGRQLLDSTHSMSVASTVARVQGAVELLRDPEAAIKWFGASESLMKRSGAVRPQPEQKRFQGGLDLAEKELGAPGFAISWKRAVGIEMDAAVALTVGASLAG